MSIITLARRLFHPTRQSAPVRFYAATKAENTKARDRRLETQLQLAVYAAVTPLDQRIAEREAYFARARQQPVRRRSAA